MTTDGSSSPSTSLIARALGGLTRGVVRFPLATVMVSLAVAVVATVLASSRMEFKTSRLDLLNPQSGYNRLWIEYIEDFGDEDDVVVVVEGDDAEQVVPVLREIAVALSAEPQHFHAILHEIDLSAIRRKGLYYLSEPQLAELARMTEGVEPLVRGDWSALQLSAMLEEAAQQPRADPSLDRLVTSLSAAIADEPQYRSPWPAMPVEATPIDTPSGEAPEYLLSNGGRLGFVLLRLVDKGDQLDRGTTAIAALRRHLDLVRVRHREVRVGLTGLPVMENDEMSESQRSSIKAGVLSLFGVACLFIAAFGGLRHPLLTIGALLVGLAWTLGYITLGVGHLNILSVSFGVILIGLGIDFGIHYVARYLQKRRIGRDSATALVETAMSVGPGVLTGGVTTALAFFASGLTPFTGVAELGVIAGGGILLCLLATLVVLPALIQLVDASRRGGTIAEPISIDGALIPSVRFPRAVLLGGAIATVALSVGMTRLWYDHNLLNLQSENLESVRWERKLLGESDHSVWYALSVAHSRDELLARKEAFERLPSVERTEDLVSHLPAMNPSKQRTIASIAERLAVLPERPRQLGVDAPQMLGEQLEAIERQLGARDPLAERLFQLRADLRALPDELCRQRLLRLQQQAAGDLLNQLHVVHAMADPHPPSVHDLPESLVTRFVGRDGGQLLKIYARGNVWDMDQLETFVKQVRSVDPRATGKPLQTYEASRQMQASYVHAAIYSLIAVLIVLVIDFRRWSLVLLALLPVAAAVVQMFGLMGWLGMPLNPANMIVLPLILGIGIDDGVHLVHDFRRRDGQSGVSRSTATAVLVTSLTTMVGFGSLMISPHQGLQSLGRVLTIGVSCCLINSLVILPAVLSWIGGDDDPPAEEEAHDTPDAKTSVRRQDTTTNRDDRPSDQPVPGDRRRSRTY